jgi:hypothetical protein
MLVPISQISQFHIPENNNIHSHYCEKLWPHKLQSKPKQQYSHS